MIRQVLTTILWWCSSCVHETLRERKKEKTSSFEEEKESLKTVSSNWEDFKEIARNDNVYYTLAILDKNFHAGLRFILKIQHRNGKL